MANNNNGNHGRSVVPETSQVGRSERNHPKPWTREEQSLLEELITEYASDNIVMRYAKIALKLPGKTMIDVALRVRWMKVNAANQQVKPSSPSTDCSTSTDISYEEIKGKSGQLFEENFQAINQISANFTPLKVDENVTLFCKIRNNFDVLSKESLIDTPEMKKMPPLPSINDYLVNEIINLLVHKRN